MYRNQNVKVNIKRKTARCVQKLKCFLDKWSINPVEREQSIIPHKTSSCTLYTTVVRWETGGSFW